MAHLGGMEGKEDVLVSGGYSSGRQTLPVNHNFTKPTVLLLVTVSLTIRLKSMVTRKVYKEKA